MNELLRVVPLFVDRTRRQAAFARSVMAMLPCLSQSAPDTPPEAPGPGEPEDVDVLSVISSQPAEKQVEAPAMEPVTADPDPPEEFELGVQDYDSLAASQVVPRLVTLSPDELRAIQRYEQANRHRQTILNRVAALLDA